jgi:2-isopropylmalate synthase
MPAERIVLGKHSGRHGLAESYRALGINLTAGELDSAYKRFTELADRKKCIYDQDLLALLPKKEGRRKSPTLSAAVEGGWSATWAS